VYNKGEWQSCTVSVKINILALVDAHIGIALETSIVHAKHCCEEYEKTEVIMIVDLSPSSRNH
jgi:hypothetical protein